MHRICLPLLGAMLLLAGCDKDAQSIETREERDPSVSAGQAYMDEGKWDEAIGEFKKALDNEPRMARPHLQLATIYHNYKLNYVYALYHYDRYLELRPDTEKADMINEQKLNVVKALAGTLINNSKEVKQVVQERNNLIKENADLKRQLASLQQTQGAAATPSTGSTRTAVTSIPKTVPPATPTTTATGATTVQHQIHHVVSGETLTKIASKYYGDSGKWDIIFEANRDTMRSAGDLKVGQTLVIPAIGN
ncbi:LysM peptidoglycan-binding domain-containing protein [Pontiella sp.]|uniref:LysM peptidoglycan-binding domain-containing protein n=1 Tax=Pontiella sp. TaxID=2837462 RepID=UPI003565F180